MKKFILGGMAAIVIVLTAISVNLYSQPSSSAGNANASALSDSASPEPCGGPKSETTANCKAENTINCKDLTGCQ